MLSSPRVYFVLNHRVHCALPGTNSRTSSSAHWSSPAPVLPDHRTDRLSQIGSHSRISGRFVNGFGPQEYLYNSQYPNLFRFFPTNECQSSFLNRTLIFCFVFPRKLSRKGLRTAVIKSEHVAKVAQELLSTLPLKKFESQLNHPKCNMYAKAFTYETQV